MPETDATTTPADPPMTPAQRWAAYLKAGLARARMSQADLGRALPAGVANDSTISKWVRAAAGVPDEVENVIAVAHALGERDSIKALEAAGLKRAAKAISDEIAAAAEDPTIARIHRADLPAHIKARMEENYLRREADKIRLFEVEFAAALREAHEARKREDPRRSEDEGSAGRTAL